MSDSVSDCGPAETRAYDSGDAYDAQYSALYEPEIRTLTQLALSGGGAVLDLCCGTGIVTVPLAQTGLPVVGVDLSEAMLKRARAKTKGVTNIAFVLQDALEFDAEQRFTLALMTGNAFQCFLTEQDITALLTRTFDMLLPGGTFIFDTRLPESYDFTLDAEFKVWSDYTDAEGNPAQFLVRQAAYDADTGVLRYEMKDVFADGSEKPSTETLKFTPLGTLRALAQRAGFGVAGEYANWDRESLLGGASSVVLELHKPESFQG